MTGYRFHPEVGVFTVNGNCKCDTQCTAIIAEFLQTGHTDFIPEDILQESVEISNTSIIWELL